MCYHKIMPRIWQQIPTAELWLVGGKPPERIYRLARDPRVRVTGFLEAVGDVLATMSVVLCPWSGTYGFRSRIVEVMALGIPVVATPAAVDGMELRSGQGIMLGEHDTVLAEHALNLLLDAEFLHAQSKLARAEMEHLYGVENTYGRLIQELKEWLESHGNFLSSRATES